MTVLHESRRLRRRTAEMWIAGVGMALAILCLGGFCLVMNGVDAATFERDVMPSLLGADHGMGPQEAFEAARVLGAWFGATLIVVLLLSTAGLFLARRLPTRRTTGWWFFAAGLVLLLGSQLILFPLAFVFFATAALFALRPLTDGSPS
ncbi:hypothetical protein ACFQS2_10390 [Brachybacterium sp. GCM10030267]|uniref:hypothetical protein n=1 Tax=unclassified Brachybacterium TaxID=2623841 RepID=UPI00361CC0B2